MNVAIRKPRMTREQFLDWAQAREERYEFDGFQPVAMTGGTINHSRISHNLYAALRTRLTGRGCEPFGPDVGVATIGDAVRYPDGLVTCTKVSGADRLVPGAVAVFEVISPSSEKIDRIDKVQEYRAVPSIRRYVILESSSIGLTVLGRRGEGDEWTATTLIAGETLQMPELGIEIPVTELYEGIDLPATEDESE
jgi:Uma2 family endonuclease